MTDREPQKFGGTLKARVLAAVAVLALTGSSAVWTQAPAQANSPRPPAGKAVAFSDNPQHIPDRPGKHLGFVVTHFYYAMFQGKDACPSGMNKILTSQEYLARQSPEERTRLLLPANARELYRGMNSNGPKGENLCEVPWAVPDAPLTMLSGDRNDGLNLDGWDGHGRPPADICPQKQYIGEHGEHGIDNQLGRIYACLNGVREKGTLEPYFTQVMRSGMWSMLIDVSGVHNGRNDPDVVVDVYAGAEPMVRDAAGNVLTNASLSPLADPKFHRRMRGKITNGVLETAPIEELTIPDIMLKKRPPMEIFRPRFQLTLAPDGTAKGMLGGYRTISTLFVAGESSATPLSYVGYQCEGMYHALRKYADGDRNPATGSCDQISMAFRIDAIPAFIVHPERQPVMSFARAR